MTKRFELTGALSTLALELKLKCKSFLPLLSALSLVLTSLVEAQQRTATRTLRTRTGQSQQGNKQAAATGAVKVVKVSEETEVTTIAGSTLKATNENRFVVVILEFQLGKEPIVANDLQLSASGAKEIPCAGLGDGRGKYGYCLDPNFKFDRGRIWENEEYFDGLCVERHGIETAGGTFSTNKPAAVFILPKTVPLRGLVLRYRGTSSSLPY